MRKKKEKRREAIGSMECGKEKSNERKCNFTSPQLPQEAAAPTQGYRRGLSLATLPAHEGEEKLLVTPGKLSTQGPVKELV